MWTGGIRFERFAPSLHKAWHFSRLLQNTDYWRLNCRRHKKWFNIKSLRPSNRRFAPPFAVGLLALGAGKSFARAFAAVAVTFHNFHISVKERFPKQRLTHFVIVLKRFVRLKSNLDCELKEVKLKDNLVQYLKLRRSRGETFVSC